MQKGEVGENNKIFYAWNKTSTEEMLKKKDGVGGEVDVTEN